MADRRLRMRRRLAEVPAKSVLPEPEEVKEAVTVLEPVSKPAKPDPKPEPELEPDFDLLVADDSDEEEDLSSLTKSQLMDLARERGVSVDISMRKSEIVDALQS